MGNRTGKRYMMVVEDHDQMYKGAIMECVEDDGSINPWFKHISGKWKKDSWWDKEMFACTIEGNLEEIKS